MVLFLFFFLLLFFSCNTQTCFGIPSTNEDVCSGNGICSALNHCICKKTYSGIKCDLRNWNENLFQSEYNIASERLLCGGDGFSNICDATGANSDVKLKPNLGELGGKTIKSLCSNKYWGIAIDSHYMVYMWGEDVDNDYLSNSNPIKLPQISPNHFAVSLRCTKSSVFVLFSNKEVYAMGKNENLELSNSYTKKETSMIKLFDNVKNIVTGEESVYVVFDSFDTNNKIEIKYAGRKYDDSGDFGFPYASLDTTNFLPNLAPRIQVIDLGVLFSFPINKHFFAGKDHPSLHTTENIPKPITFGYQSQLKTEDPIDLIGRPKGGCLLIASENEFFVSGNNCPDYSLDTPSLHPYKITHSQKYQFSDSQVLIDMKCHQKVCYLLTEESVFAFGKDLPSEMLSFPHSTAVRRFESTRNDFLFLIPSMGSNRLLSFAKPSIFRTIDKTKVNAYPPKFIESESGLIADKLTIKLEKPEGFNQYEPIIKLRGGKNDENLTCNYPGEIGNSIWKFSNKDHGAIKGGMDLYETTKDWSYHTKHCGWIKNVGIDYTSFDNRIFFSEFYWLNYQQSMILERREDYSLDVKLLFKNWIVVDTDITVKKNNISIQAIVVSKLFDRDTKTGELFVQLRNEYPQITENVNIISFTNPSHFIKEKFEITEILGKRECDTRYCYQIFRLTYQVAPEICFPKSNIRITGNNNCISGKSSHPNCFSTIPNTLDATINLLLEDVCVKLVGNIDLNGTIDVYQDWLFTKKQTAFRVNDFAYFITEVDSSNATIINSKIEQISFNTNILLMNFLNTDKGNKAGLAMDKLNPPSNNKNAFHFRILQEHTLLPYGTTEQFKVCVRITVTYLGNERRTFYFTRSIPINSDSNSITSSANTALTTFVDVISITETTPKVLGPIITPYIIVFSSLGIGFAMFPLILFCCVCVGSKCCCGLLKRKRGKCC